MPGVRIYPFKEVESGAVVDRHLIWESRMPSRLFGRDAVAGLINVDLTPETTLRIGIALGTVRVDVAGIGESRTHTGWAGGLGMEVGLTPHWSAKAEYLYVDLTDRNYALTGIANGLESNILRLGVNYRF